MGVFKLYPNNIKNTTTPITGETQLNDHIFIYEIYLVPIIGTSSQKRKRGVEKTVNETITELSRRLGNRIQNGKVCLDVTEELARDNIENADYSAIVFVKNKNHDDEASGTMQYFNWCSDNQDDPNEAQIWINDLCRISTEKQQVSPLEVLIKLFESIVVKYVNHINYIHLMVDKIEESSIKLQQIYNNKYNFFYR